MTKALVDHLWAPKLEEGKGGQLQWGMDETYKGDWMKCMELSIRTHA